MTPDAFINSDAWCLPPGTARIDSATVSRVSVYSPWWKFWRPRRLITNERMVTYRFTLCAGTLKVA